MYVYIELDKGITDDEDRAQLNQVQTPRGTDRLKRNNQIFYKSEPASERPMAVIRPLFLLPLRLLLLSVASVVSKIWLAMRTAHQQQVHRTRAEAVVQQKEEQLLHALWLRAKSQPLWTVSQSVARWTQMAG